MKLSFYTYTLLFFAVLLGAVQNSYGQIPPYEYSYTKLLYKDYTNRLYYEREDIPFYSIFNYPSVKEYDLESTLKLLNYRNYNSFTAPKGIEKITYHLGNNPVDSVCPAKYVFYFNNKTHLLEKEIKYQSNMLSSISADTINIEQYIYQYKEDKEYFIVKKLLQSKDSLILLQKYIYSKDRSKLIETEFLSREYDWDLTRNRFRTNPSRKKVIFCYNTEKEIVDILLDDINILTYPTYNENINYDTIPKSEHRWSDKQSWSSLLELDEDISKTISFPEKIDLNFNKKIFRCNYVSIPNNYRKKETLELYIETMNSKNIHRIRYFEEHYIGGINARGTDKDSFKTVKTIIWGKNNDIKTAYFISGYHIDDGLSSPHSLSFINNDTPTSYTFIFRNSIKKNTYIIKSVVKDSRDLGVTDIFRDNKYGPKDYYFKDSFKEYQKAKSFKNESYTLEFKPKKGLNEIYIIKNNQKYPLITIN